jgi:hypothetical protein
MEIENHNEKTQQINAIKLLYEDFLKTVSNYLCSDAEILILDYMIDKSKDGELEIPDEKVPQIFKFDKNSISASFIRLSKSKFIEIKEKNIGILNNPQNAAPIINMRLDRNNFRFEKKTEKFYRLNRKLIEEFPPILEKFKKIIEQDLSFDYMCPRCNKNYKVEDVFLTNQSLEPGKFRCKDTSCSSYLHELTEAETKASNATMSKVLEVLQVIQGKFDAIKDKEWPFRKITIDRNMNGNNNDEKRFSNNNNANAGETRVEEEESSKETWGFRCFKSFFMEKYGVNFDYLQFAARNKLIKSGENHNHL